jgi:hypothetical protein
MNIFNITDIPKCDNLEKEKYEKSQEMNENENVVKRPNVST